jgi:peptide/nickel transport system permease protein
MSAVQPTIADPGLDVSAEALAHTAPRRRSLRAVLRWPSFWALVAILALGLLAPVIAPYDPVDPNPTEKLLAPSGDHLFGTDPLGMDIFSRVLHAIRIDLTLALAAVALGVAVGVPLGALAGYAGGIVDRFLARLSETVQAFPQILLGMALVAALGSGRMNLVIIIAVVNLPVYLMMVRSVALPLRGSDFVDAARAAGVPGHRIVLRYILPNALVPVFSQVALSCAYAIQLIAALSFIGLGIRTPTPEWGAMINQGASYIVFGQWWPSIIPGAAIFISVFVLMRLSGGLRRLLLGSG